MTVEQEQRLWEYGRPMLLDDFVALPVHETAVCPECTSSASITGEVCRCRCGYIWRWPSMGLD